MSFDESVVLWSGHAVVVFQYGLMVSLKTPEPSPPMAAMISGFQEAGIPVTVEHAQSSDPASTRSCIGLRPAVK